MLIMLLKQIIKTLVGYRFLTAESILLGNGAWTLGKMAGANWISTRGLAAYQWRLTSGGEVSQRTRRATDLRSFSKRTFLNQSNWESKWRKAMNPLGNEKGRVAGSPKKNPNNRFGENTCLTALAWNGGKRRVADPRGRGPWTPRAKTSAASFTDRPVVTSWPMRKKARTATWACGQTLTGWWGTIDKCRWGRFDTERWGARKKLWELEDGHFPPELEGEKWRWNKKCRQKSNNDGTNVSKKNKNAYHNQFVFHREKNSWEVLRLYWINWVERIASPQHLKFRNKKRPKIWLRGDAVDVTFDRIAGSWPRTGDRNRRPEPETGNRNRKRFGKKTVKKTVVNFDNYKKIEFLWNPGFVCSSRIYQNDVFKVIVQTTWSGAVCNGNIFDINFVTANRRMDFCIWEMNLDVYDNRIAWSEINGNKQNINLSPFSDPLTTLGRLTLAVLR